MPDTTSTDPSAAPPAPPSAAGVELEPAPSDVPVPVTPDEDIGEVRGYPKPVQYSLVAIVLFVLTSLEVWLFYLEGTIPDGAITGLLLVLGLCKFLLVVSFYMHLREDKPIFRRLFVLGLLAALTLYAIVLATFELIF
jgi:cytochrome c oxidase subunit 4